MHLCMPNIMTSQNKDWYSSKESPLLSTQHKRAVQYRFFSQIKRRFFHFNKMNQLYRKCFCTAVIKCPLYASDCFKKRQEELAVTDESHDPQQVIGVFKGIRKYLKRNYPDTVCMDFQTLWTVLSKSQKGFVLICKETILSWKQKRSFCETGKESRGRNEL